MDLFKITASELQDIFANILCGAAQDDEKCQELMQVVFRLTQLPVDNVVARTTFSCIVMPYGSRSIARPGPLATAIISIIGW